MTGGITREPSFRDAIQVDSKSPAKELHIDIGTRRMSNPLPPKGTANPSDSVKSGSLLKFLAKSAAALIFGGVVGFAATLVAWPKLMAVGLGVAVVGSVIAATTENKAENIKLALKAGVTIAAGPIGAAFWTGKLIRDFWKEYKGTAQS